MSSDNNKEEDYWQHLISVHERLADRLAEIDSKYSDRKSDRKNSDGSTPDRPDKQR